MNQKDFSIIDDDQSSHLMRFFFIALAIEALALTLLGRHNHWLAHPQKASDDASRFVEAQVFEIPKEAHLVDESKSTVPKATHEAIISKKPHSGREAKPNEGKLQEENQTQAGPPPVPTHGPIAIVSPAPVIPTYLQDKDLRASAVIDFFISAQGTTTPKLVGSSGNEELDAIAISTAKKWQFRPAEKDHHPIDSKIRLRIVFEVK